MKLILIDCRSKANRNCVVLIENCLDLIEYSDKFDIPSHIVDDISLLVIHSMTEHVRNEMIEHDISFVLDNDAIDNSENEFYSKVNRPMNNHNEYWYSIQWPLISLIEINYQRDREVKEHSHHKFEWSVDFVSSMNESIDHDLVRIERVHQLISMSVVDGDEREMCEVDAIG